MSDEFEKQDANYHGEYWERRRERIIPGTWHGSIGAFVSIMDILLCVTVDLSLIASGMGRMGSEESGDRQKRAC